MIFWVDERKLLVFKARPDGPALIIESKAHLLEP
jgi:hypothetical protein